MLESMMAMLGYLPTIAEVAAGKPRDHARHPQWPAFRDRFVKVHPECAACGRKKYLQAHHVLPFHLRPDRELDDSNLIVLCEPPGIGCHLAIGHLWDFRSWNPEVREDARIWRKKISVRPYVDDPDEIA